ncbi:MAG: hypothetical protein J0H98_10440 [Solirubrobacterales bacterium]|nr:hypothetical protein [Solirubrobacterales bacterium]
MALFNRGGQSGRERRAMRDHLGELDDMRRKNLSELGQMTVEMASEGRFDRQKLSEQAAEVVKIDREADLIARGLEEGLTLQELEDLARGGEESGNRSR